MDAEDQARYSAGLPTGGVAKPPGEADVVRVRDVLLIQAPGWAGGYLRSGAAPSMGSGKARTDATRTNRPGPRTNADKLDRQEADRLLYACSPRGHYFVPVKQYGPMYSFDREVGLDEIELSGGHGTRGTDLRCSRHVTTHPR